ncbi:hypothetical protein CYY_002598 [Polysphondylium violaceum]|uniref:Vps52 / Sac2 family protein n=1 Tax=Polysphondylium violaceum TaxID=133409 RepID=A0A8J4PZV6_9MYCE|nr:hypothetical protein CYY_002598 [Polysphondylium violaceum]
MNTPPKLSKQSSKLMVTLNKDRSELDVDDLGELDITTILGSDFDDDSISFADQETIKEALIKGYDLRQYSKDVHNELTQCDRLTINDYFSERENFLTLYNQIQVIDGVLETLEQMLNNYYNDLKNIGSEMNSLQERSLSMNHKLNNRKQLKEKLAKFVEDVSIAQEFSNYLTKAEINEDYVKCLMSLDTKITLFDDYKALSPAICANNEPQLSKLTVASIQKIQKFLDVMLMSSFKKLQDKRMKQSQLSGLGYLFQFLFKYSSYTANQVINSYVENGEKYFTSLYKSYINSLLKMVDETSGPVTNKSKIKSLFGNSNSGSGNSKSNNNGQHHLKMNDFLSNELLEAPFIEPPPSTSLLEAGAQLANNIANTNTSAAAAVKYPFDQLYRSILFFLMDLVTFETGFVKDFFLGGEDVTATIFGKSIAILIETTENYLSNSPDFMNVLVILGMLQKYKGIMNARGINLLNAPFDKLIGMVFARFNKTFVKEIEHIRGVNVKELKSHLNPLVPHPMVKRYADLVSSLVYVNEHIPKESSNQGLSRYIAELKTSLEKLISTVMMNEIESKDQQLVFLLNNYGLVVQTLLDSCTVVTSIDDQNARPFNQLFNSVIGKYINSQILNLKYLTQFSTFANEWGPLVESNVKIDLKENPSFNIQNVTDILKSFEQNWKSAVAVIKDDSIKNFKQCPIAATKTFDKALIELHYCYRLLCIIINKHFPTLKSNANYKGNRTILEMKEMNPSLEFDLIQDD